MRGFLALLLLAISIESFGYKILVFSPRFGRSHVKFAGSIADALTEAGHQVVVLLYEVNPNVKMNGTKLARTVMIPIHDSAKEFYKDSKRFSDIWVSDYSALLSQYEEMNQVGALLSKTCAHVNAHNNILDSFKSVKFDLAVAEIFDACAFGLIERLGIPAHVATTSSILLDGHATALGVPRQLSYVPSAFSPYNDQMSLTERFWNLINSRVAEMFHESVVVREQKLFRKLYGKRFISLNEKIAQSAFVLTNSDPLYDFPRATIPKIIPVGGLNVEKPNALNEEWDSLLKQRPKALIISFGTVAQSYFMPVAMKKTILNAFSQFPETTFIWKYEKAENIAKDYVNVVVADWIPQNDLLNDARVAGLVTHGGINSIHEAVHAGKPLILVPLFGDQPRNSKMVERANIGLVLRKEQLMDEKTLIKALSLLLNNDSYSKSVQHLSSMVRRNAANLKQTVVRHLEFAAEFGNLPMLDVRGRKQSVFQFYFIDILIIFVVLYIITVSAVLYALRLYILDILGLDIKIRRKAKEVKPSPKPKGKAKKQ